ncbi:hypothetical protein [Anaerocolumna aminovalerica]|uniref:hypothetical protein n=1 Tax=Anaerocolumna aminovalerica TaxID=1527 RepID=UPI000BE2D6B7|nr:hypothetical protein [Anaerocolumna aminovalerica]
MNIDKYIKKGLIFSLIFIFIGILAGITGFVFDYHLELMRGLTVGFLPTGIGMLILYKYSNKKPELRKNIELENEERNIFINTKAGYMAFWICYFYVFLAVLLNQIMDIPVTPFLIITLCLMPIVYFALVIIYHKKY